MIYVREDIPKEELKLVGLSHMKKRVLLKKHIYLFGSGYFVHAVNPQISMINMSLTN